MLPIGILKKLKSDIVTMDPITVIYKRFIWANISMLWLRQGIPAKPGFVLYYITFTYKNQSLRHSVSDLEYLGALLYGPSEEINLLTKNFRLWS